MNTVPFFCFLDPRQLVFRLVCLHCCWAGRGRDGLTQERSGRIAMGEGGKRKYASVARSRDLDIQVVDRANTTRKLTKTTRLRFGQCWLKAAPLWRKKNETLRLLVQRSQSDRKFRDVLYMYDQSEGKTGPTKWFHFWEPTSTTRPVMILIFN